MKQKNAVSDHLHGVFFQRVGAALRLARETQHLKLDTVAKATGIKQPVISNIENGKYYGLKLESLVILVLYYKVNMKDILPEPGDMWKDKVESYFFIKNYISQI